MRRLVFTLLFAIIAIHSSASAQGYRGRDFWLCFPQNALTEAGRLVQHTIFISSESRTTGVVENMMDGSRTPFSIEAGASISISLDTALQITSSGQIGKQSVHVTSEKEISLYAASHRPASTDSYSAIPTEFLGTDYVVVGYDPLTYSDNESGFATQCDVIATEDNTLITFHLSAATKERFEGGHTVIPAGRTVSMALNRGETLQFQSSMDAGEKKDLTGTTVTASKPIAFFTGHSCAQVPVSVSYCDILLEMEPPAKDWGKDFILTRFIGKDYYIARVVANADGTDVTINGESVARLKKGEYYEAKHLVGDAIVRTSKPALVAQYATSSDADTIKIGDPFMLLAIPNDRFIPEVTTSSVTAGGFYHYLNIVVPDTAVATLTIDDAIIAGKLIPHFISHYSANKVRGTDYTVLSFKINEGRHLVHCAAPIAVYSYGFGVIDNNYDSYGHACGQRLGK